MNMPQPPDDPALSDAVNDCLDALRQGDSIDNCLGRYPDIADELRPLLAAATAMAGVAPIRDDAARRIAHARFEGAVRHHLSTNRRGASGRFSFRDWWNSRASGWSRVWAVGFTAVALFAVLSTGAAYASTNAMPDSPLYPVKRATEHARLAITFSDDSRAIYHLELIERRTLELAAVAETGDTEQVAKISRDVLKNIEFARVEAGVDTSADSLQQQDAAPQAEIAIESIEIEMAPQSQPTVDGEPGPASPSLEIVETADNPRLRAYIEAERATAARAYATLQIAHQLAPPEGRAHVLNALTLAEQRYRQTRYPGEPAPISRTVFAQGIVRINDGVMTMGGSLAFEIARNALGNRPPHDGDFATVGGYVRDDGVLLVLRLYALEVDGVAEDRIWLQAETLGRSDEHIFIPGFNVTPHDWSQISQPSNQDGRWLYVYGTLTDNGAVAGEDVHLIGNGPTTFPLP